MSDYDYIEERGYKRTGSSKRNSSYNVEKSNRSINDISNSFKRSADFDINSDINNSQGDGYYNNIANLNNINTNTSNTLNATEKKLGLINKHKNYENSEDKLWQYSDNCFCDENDKLRKANSIYNNTDNRMSGGRYMGSLEEIKEQIAEYSDERQDNQNNKPNNGNGNERPVFPLLRSCNLNIKQLNNTMCPNSNIEGKDNNSCADNDVIGKIEALKTEVQNKHSRGKNMDGEAIRVTEEIRQIVDPHEQFMGRKLNLIDGKGELNPSEDDPYRSHKYDAITGNNDGFIHVNDANPTMYNMLLAQRKKIGSEEAEKIERENNISLDDIKHNIGANL